MRSKILCVSLAIMAFLMIVNEVSAGMGSFGASKKKEKTAQDLLEERKNRRPAKMQDVLWDKNTQGMIRIFVKPSANLYIDGVLQLDPKGKRRKSERYASALTAGTHVLKMERDGFETQERKVVIEAGKPYSENFVLIKAGQNREEMVLIPAGEFWMGIDKYDLKFIIRKIGGEKRFHRNESPRRKENVAAFYIDKYEVTNAQYKKFVAAAGREVLPDDWENGTYPAGKDHFPVAYVTWYDADDYCKWAGKRLPTEKEWEKAARWSPTKTVAKGGGDSSFFAWGNRFHRNNTNTRNGGPGHTTITGRYEKGKSSYGIYDMTGNVKEWTSDWYADYPGSKFKDEFAASGEVKVAKGGSFLENPFESMANCRFKYSQGTAYDDLGFRCAKDAK